MKRLVVPSHHCGTLTSSWVTHDTLSEPCAIDIGTCLGTCLGPLLFNVVSNSISCYIPSNISGFSTFSDRYADDTQVAISGPRNKLPELKLVPESLLDTLSTWFSQHGMKVNAGKTELLMCTQAPAGTKLATSQLGLYRED